MIVGQLSELSTHPQTANFAEKILAVIDAAADYPMTQWVELSTHLKFIRLNDWNRTADVFEAHRRYIDVHVATVGADRITICIDQSDAIVVQPYDEGKDVVLCKAKADGEVTVRPGTFSLLNRDELHRNEFVLTGTEKLSLRY